MTQHQNTELPDEIYVRAKTRRDGGLWWDRSAPNLERYTRPAKAVEADNPLLEYGVVTAEMVSIFRKEFPQLADVTNLNIAYGVSRALLASPRHKEAESQATQNEGK